MRYAMSPSEKCCQLRVAHPLDAPLALSSPNVSPPLSIEKTDRGRTGHGRDQRRGSLCVSALNVTVE